jgi:hypothetical protein
MPAFPDILSRLYMQLRTAWQPAVLIIFIVSALLFSVQVGGYWHTERMREKVMSEENMRSDIDRLHELLAIQRSGTEDVQEQIRLQQRKVAARFHMLGGRTDSEEFLLATLPSRLATGALTFLLLLFGFCLSVRLAITHEKRTFSVFLSSASALWPMLKMVVSLLFLSFLWLPLFMVISARFGWELFGDMNMQLSIFCVFLGYFLAILLLPRLLLAPLFLFEEGQTVKSSIFSSWNASRGHWGKILWSSIGFSFVLFTLSVTSILAVQSVFGLNKILSLGLWSVCMQSSVFFFAQFLLLLTCAVDAHPASEFSSEENIVPEATPAVTSAA